MWDFSMLIAQAQGIISQEIKTQPQVQFLQPQVVRIFIQEDDELSIGKLIKKQRKEKGLTQQALAEELNVSSQAISKWEREICEPDKQLWVKLSKILDIPKERFACLYEAPADNGDVTVPPGVIAALNTFADALSMVKSNMWGGKNDDRDSDN